MTKQEHLNAWLTENPGKTKRDWLIEVRCPNNDQRKQFQDFLAFCDKNAIELVIPSRTEWINRIPVQYDFAIKEYGAVYDLDTPDELYTGKHGHNEAGWKPFLDWKWEQVTKIESQFGAPLDLEKNHYGQYVNTYCYKWNHPEVLETLKKYFSKTK